MALQDYYNTSANSETHFYGTEWVGQTFLTNQAYNISSVKVKLFRVGTPGTVTVGIRATDGDGKPTGADLVSGTLDGNSLTTDSAGEWKEVSFGSPYSLSAATVYAIVVRAPSGSGPNRGDWKKQTGNAYANGDYAYSSDSGSSWIVNDTADHNFETYGDPPATYADCAGTCAGVGAASGDLGFTAVFIEHSALYRRLVAAGNDQIWYEDI